MLLLIDAGNTRIKWALADMIQSSPTDLGVWKQTGSLSHQELLTTTPAWNNFAVKRVVASNVAGKIVRDRLMQLIEKQNVVPEWFESQAAIAGIKNTYHDPVQLGSDRFAAAIAARALFSDQTCIIATCGTALTIDAVTADGVFAGGMIVPGLQLMARSLAKNIPHLPTISAAMMAPVYFANHTEAAMINGCLAAQAGAIEYARRQFAASTTSNPLCVISGGSAKYIVPSLNIPYRLIDNLVLIGLQVVASC